MQLLSPLKDKYPAVLPETGRGFLPQSLAKQIVQTRVVWRGCQLFGALWSRSATQLLSEASPMWSASPSPSHRQTEELEKPLDAWEWGAGTFPWARPWDWASIHHFWDRYLPQLLTHDPDVAPPAAKWCSRLECALLEPGRAVWGQAAPPPPDHDCTGWAITAHWANYRPSNEGDSAQPLTWNTRPALLRPVTSRIYSLMIS